MANFRQVHVFLWKDEWFLEQEPNKKLLFIYLFTNPLASMAGIYKIPISVICFETGLMLDYVQEALKEFAADDKAYYQDGVMWVVNMRKYHETSSIKVQTRIEADLQKIPEGTIKLAYMTRLYNEKLAKSGYPIDTVSPEGNTVSNSEEYPMDTSSLKYNIKRDKKRKNKKRKEGAPISEDHDSGDSGGGGFSFLFEMWDLDPDGPAGKRYISTIQKQIEPHGEAKVRKAAEVYKDRGMSFNDAIAKLVETLPAYSAGYY
jgi:hypothetical protein